MIEIVRAQTRHHHSLCVYIRIRVFMDEQRYTLENELEPDEDDAVFFLAMENGNPVGTVRYRVLEETRARIERLAVLPEYRRKNIGPQLMDAVLKELTGLHSLKTIELIAQENTVKFHEKYGFKPTGAPHLEAGHLHYLMVKSL